VRLQLGRNRNCKKDICDDIYARGVSRKSNKLRIREKSDGVQNNPSCSINTIRHSVVCGASRCPDGRLVYSFCIIANLIAGSVRSIGDQWIRDQEYVKLCTNIRLAAPSPIVMWERLVKTFYCSEVTSSTCVDVFRKSTHSWAHSYTSHSARTLSSPFADRWHDWHAAANDRFIPAKCLSALRQLIVIKSSPDARVRSYNA